MTIFQIKEPAEAYYPAIEGVVPSIEMKLRASATFSSSSVDFDEDDTYDTSAFLSMPDLRVIVKPRANSGTKSIAASGVTLTVSDQYKYTLDDDPDAVNTSYYYIDNIEHLLEITDLDSLKSIVIQTPAFVPEAPSLVQLVAGDIDGGGVVLGEQFPNKNRQAKFDRSLFYSQDSIHIITQLQSRHPNLDVNAGYQNALPILGSENAKYGYLYPTYADVVILCDFLNAAEGTIVPSLIAAGAGGLATLGGMGLDTLAKKLGAMIEDRIHRDNDLATKLTRLSVGSIGTIALSFSTSYLGSLAFGASQRWVSLSDFNVEHMVTGALNGLSLLGSGVSVAGNAISAFLPTSTGAQLGGKVLSAGGNLITAYGSAVAYLDMMATKTVWQYW
jgi:hypothetical protein